MIGSEDFILYEKNMEKCMAVKKRYIIVDEKKGAFVGTFSPEDAGNEFAELVKAYQDKGARTTKLGLLFASDNVYDIRQCAAFPTYKDAEGFIHWMLTTFKGNKETFKLRLSILPCETEGERFATALELLKAGYVRYIHGMSDNLFELYAENEDSVVH